MTENTVSKNKVVINDVEYIFEDMTDEQKVLVNHVADLDRKLNSARFSLDQLQGGRNYFMGLLEQALKGNEGIVDDKAT